MNTGQKLVRRISRYGAMLAVLSACLFLVSSLPERVAAAPSYPLTVEGYVYDISVQKVVGADVQVSLVEKPSVVKTAVTDSNGKYKVIFSETEWDLGQNIKVVATKGADSGENTKYIDQDVYDFGYAQVDVHFGSFIPEFGSAVGFLVAVFVVGVVAVMVVGKKRT